MVTIAWIVVGTGAGIEPLGLGIDTLDVPEEISLALEIGVVSGISGTIEVSGGTIDDSTGTVVVPIDAVIVSTGTVVDPGGGTQYVHTVEVLVTKMVDTVEVVSTEVLLPLVMVLVTGHVVKVVRILEKVS